MIHSSQNPSPTQDTYLWEDEYPNIALEDFTYADMDWDEIDPALVNRHDAILEMSADELDQLDLEGAQDLFRWAAARARLSQGSLDSFFFLARKILSTPQEKQSEHLSYPDICLEVARLMGSEDLNQALLLLQDYQKRKGADPVEYARYKALLLVDHQDPALGQRLLIDTMQQNTTRAAQLGSEFAEALIDRGRYTEAIAILEEAISMAERMADLGLADELRDIHTQCQKHLAPPSETAPKTTEAAPETALHSTEETPGETHTSPAAETTPEKTSAPEPSVPEAPPLITDDEDAAESDGWDDPND